MSYQRAKNPTHIENNMDSGAALEVPTMQYYEIYDMLGPLDVCWYLDCVQQSVECVLCGQLYKRISVFLVPSFVLPWILS